MSKNLKIKVIVKKGTTHDGKTFNYFRAVDKNGKLTDLRFCKGVNTPKENCVMIVDSAKINLDTNREFPCYWVKDIVEYQPIELVVSNKIDELFEQC